MLNFELMRTFLLIFALIMSACSGEICKECPRFDVTISPASPIQFWPSDCSTYNEKEVCGIFPRCYCAPWQCGDEMKLQFTDTEILQYVLIALDENETELFSQEFEYFQDSRDVLEDAPLNVWTNLDNGGNAWTLGSNPSVSVFDFATDFLRVPIEGPEPGTYEFDYDFDAVLSGGPTLSFAVLNIDLYKDGTEVGGTSVIINSAGHKTGTRTFLITDIADEIRVYIYQAPFVGLPTVTVDINSFDFVIPAGPVIYSTSFIPEDENICNEKIQLRIVDMSASPDSVVAKSDCIDVREFHACTELIEYSNNRNFAGLYYTELSPSPTFQIRVPMVFFHENFPQEDFAMELSTGIEKTNSFLKKQREMEIGYVPYYMHEKLILIFMHQNIFTDNKYWTKEEEYEVIVGNKRHPLKKGRVLLTERNFVQRAVL